MAIYMTPVEELLVAKDIPYKISGKDVVIKCLNPNHDDTNPSMRVDRHMGMFNCFACDFKGNIFKHFDVSVSQVGIKREGLLRLISSLRASSIGLSVPEDAMPYAGGWRGIKPETYVKFGAFKHHASHFLGRIVFPIKDASGRIVSFQGRDDSGTLNSKYMFWPSGAKLPLFPQVKPVQGKVILVEGIFDMLNLHDKGLENAVCCFGAKNFTKEKLNHLKISGAQGMDILFDADDAGQDAAEQIKKLAEDFPVRTIKLKNGDPAEFNEAQVQGLRRKLYG